VSPNVLPLEQETIGYLNLVIYSIGKRNLDDSNNSNIKSEISALRKFIRCCLRNTWVKYFFFCVGFRTFALSNRVYKGINYYIEPKETIERLGNILCQGKFCLLIGHQQSGKSTIAYATEEWLRTNYDKEVSSWTLTVKL